ncbi:MAG TPA: methylmalonyl-CoA epimerase [Solirubrobacteraceae bacterium]|nr:methylmalonyl-CoA epimerase [Solirubrobacteraceae bacterium]
MFESIDHVGIAVEAIDPSLGLFEGTFGLTVSHREIVDQQGVEALLLDIGDSHLELLAPLGPETPVGRFLAKRGPGLHHLAYRVPDVAAALSACKAQGLRVIDDTPRTGIRNSQVAFLHPSSTGGVLTELVQPAPDH